MKKLLTTVAVLVASAIALGLVAVHAESQFPSARCRSGSRTRRRASAARRHS